MDKRKTALWIGDAACPSGFALGTHKILEGILPEYEPYVLGINYRGDPTINRDLTPIWPYRIWSAGAGGDYIGVGRMIWMCDLIQQETGAPPDVIVLLNDGWNIPPYIRQLRLKKANGEYAWPQYAGIPVVAMVAVDGKNFTASWLDGIDHTAFWTQFALDEAREAGFVGQASVIPLGVDTNVYKPMDKQVARRSKGIGNIEDKFIVGNVNRNQPRKRWDLTIKYFAEWVYKGMRRELRDGENMKIKDAYLFLHVAPTGDDKIKVLELCQYYGILGRLAYVEPPTWYGVPEEEMVQTYNCFDVSITTTQGEGFGLTTLEAMACGVPVIVPKWSALGDWTTGAAWQVPCTSTAIGPPYVNVVGGIADEEDFIKALNFLYQNQGVRDQNSRAALERARQERFSWPHIGKQFLQVLNSVTSPAPAAVAEEVAQS